MVTPLVRKPPHRPVTPGLPLFAAALGAALVGASLAHLLQPELAAPPASDAAGPLAQVSPSAPRARVSQPAARPGWLQPPPAGTPLPELAELQTLRAALTHGAGPTADVACVGEQMLFADTTRLVAALAVQPGDGAELRAAAELLNELLLARAQRGEMPADELRQMQWQLQAVLPPAQRSAPVSAR